MKYLEYSHMKYGSIASESYFNKMFTKQEKKTIYKKAINVSC